MPRHDSRTRHTNFPDFHKEYSPVQLEKFNIAIAIIDMTSMHKLSRAAAVMLPTFHHATEP